LDRLAAGAAPRTWAVIADADETMIDNSGYNKYQDEIGAAYSDSSWRRYVHEESAPALPGAVEFARLVHRLGGHLVVVTNRENSLCDATHSNLTKDSIEADVVLCRTTTGDKNPRFASVTAGTASPSLPPLKVLMWLGDNIQDFPTLTQKLRDGSDADYSNFGRIYFVFPNPMYGSWERVPYL
jgi:5'-nucleotidase (lipoprotein e(P4) family)